jgi:arginyl-tRNA--protein-N-Asp/Glu arginylyltransferase
MESLFRYVASPSRCGYLPEQSWSLEYEYVGALSPAEYLQRMLDGWRRFGTMLFRPACTACRACRALRVPAARFRPDRGQRRAWKANHGEVALRIGEPSVTRAKVNLYDRYHEHQTDAKGWPQHPARDAASYAESFVHHPFAVEEWCYYLDNRLVGVGYVDALPTASAMEAAGARDDVRLPSPDEMLPGGLSAIYFFYEPNERHRSLGTYNVLCLLEEAARRALPYVYLGYFVEGCGSMQYKARFAPNEVRGEDGCWRTFRE